MTALEQSLKRSWTLVAAAFVIGIGLTLAGFLWWNVPVPVTFDYDEPGQKIFVEGPDGTARKLDLAEKKTWPLPPGLYKARADATPERRRLEPATFLVTPRTPEKQTFRLVGEIRREFHSLSVTDVAMSPVPGSTWAASSSRDQRLGLWDTSTDKAAFLDTHKSHVLCVAFSPDGKRGASGSGMAHRKPEMALCVWDVEKQKVQHFLPHAAWVVAVAFSPKKNEVLAGLNDGSVVVWDLDREKIQHTLIGHDRQGVTRVAYSPDGLSAFSAGRDAKIVHWDVVEGKELQVFEGHNDAVRSIATSPDGDRLASCGIDGTIQVWDISTGEGKVAVKTGKSLYALAWSADGHRWITGDNDGNVRLWNARTSDEIANFRGQHKGKVQGVAFSADHRRALSGGVDGVLSLWELPP